MLKGKGVVLPPFPDQGLRYVYSALLWWNKETGSMREETVYRLEVWKGNYTNLQGRKMDAFLYKHLAR